MPVSTSRNTPFYTSALLADAAQRFQTEGISTATGRVNTWRECCYSADTQDAGPSTRQRARHGGTILSGMCGRFTMAGQLTICSRYTCLSRHLIAQLRVCNGNAVAHNRALSGDAHDRFSEFVLLCHPRNHAVSCIYSLDETATDRQDDRQDSQLQRHAPAQVAYLSPCSRRRQPSSTCFFFFFFFSYTQDFGYFGPETEDRVKWSAEQALGKLTSL
jgi:hypothetical protein